MRLINYENLIKNNNYYIQNNEIKYLGIFVKIYYYDYYCIAEFKDVVPINSFHGIEKIEKMEKHFIIQNHYFNTISFYVPELEPLLLEQILRQKTNDHFFANSIAKTLM
jgi:hypothetical protein